VASFPERGICQSQILHFQFSHFNSITMNFLEILQGQLSDDVLGHISNQIGAEKEQTASAANSIFTTLVGGLAGHASSESGLSGLTAMLDSNHDGSVLDDLMGMVTGMTQGGGDQQPAVNALDGAGILNTILGDRQEAAAQHISQSSGLSIGQIMKLMPILAPIVMGVIGRARNQGGIGMSDIAGILMGSTQNAQQGGMGDLIGSVLGGVFGGGQQTQAQQPQQGGDMISNILGGIFGAK